MTHINQRVNAIMGVIIAIMLVITSILFSLYFNLNQKNTEVEDLQALINTDYIIIDFVRGDYIFKSGDDIQLAVTVNNLTTNTISVNVVYRVNKLNDGVWYALDTDPNVYEYYITELRKTDQIPGVNVYTPTSFVSEQTEKWEIGEYRVQLVYSYNFLTPKEDSTTIQLSIV